jgi:hypothetical protein
MSTSSGTVYSGAGYSGGPNFYGESSARSNNEHDAEVRQVGFDLSEAPQEPQPPNTTVEAGEVGAPGPSGPKVKALADLTSAFNEVQTKQNTKKKNVVASQHDVEVPTSTTPPRAFFASAALPDMPSAPFTGTGEPT